MHDRKELSDEEYVELIRRRLERTPRRRALSIGFHVVVSAGIVGLVYAALSGMPGFVQQGMNIGLAFGLVLGFLFGHLVHNAVRFLSTALAEPRTDRLLIRYHDERRELAARLAEAEEPPLSSPAAPPRCRA